MKPLVEVLTATTEWFRARGIPSARLDAELILGHVLGLDRVKVYLNFDRPLSETELEEVRALVRRRGAREPLAWLTEEKEFYGRPFTVKPGVLVPRPDTETLVEAALPLLTGDPVHVADVGCGSGAIGLTLALENPGVRLFALDLSEEALACTRANVERHGLKERVAVRKSDLLGGVPEGRPLDWVVSNPPYIPSDEIPNLAPEVRLEPRLALDGGADGLAAYRRLIPEAARRARLGVILEVGKGQAPAVGALLRDAGLTVSVATDLAGVERVVLGRAPPTG